MDAQAREPLIPLAAAHAFQLKTEKDGTAPWEIQENKTNNLLAVLPRELTDAQMFKILAFAREFELRAFNIGMNYMKEQLFDSWDKEREGLHRVIHELEAANSRLADKLGKFIGEEEI